MAWKKKVHKLGQCVQNLPFTKKLDGAFEHNFFFFFSIRGWEFEHTNLKVKCQGAQGRGDVD